MPRPPKISREPSLIGQASHLAREGLPIRFIAPQIGIAEKTMRTYLKNGLEASDIPEADRTDLQELYHQFWLAYEEGRSDYVKEVHQKITENAEPRTLLTLLGRLFPDVYGEKTTFHEDDLERWLSRSFSEEAQEKIRQIMKEDLHINYKR